MDATKKDAYLIILADAAMQLKSMAKSFRQEATEAARKAGQMSGSTKLATAMSEHGWAEDALRKTTDAKRRLDEAVATLKTTHYIGRICLCLTAEEFTATTGLDAETYEAKS